MRPLIQTFISVFFVLASHATYGNEIETITVTATRQSETLESIDRSLYTLTAQDVAQINGQHVNQTLSRIPGAWISRGNGQEHLTAIRSPVLTGAGGCGAFYIAQDGISVRAPGFCNANQLFDINTEQAASIEVLNGPASVLYGSNAVHGVINVLTPSPFDSTDQQLGLELGPNDYQRLRFVLSDQDAEDAVMLYGVATDDGGYKDSSGYEQQKINLIYQTNWRDWRVKTVAAATNLNQQTAGFVEGFEAYKDARLKRQNPNPDAYRNSQSVRLYSQLEKNVEDQGKLSLTPYIRWAQMDFLQHFLPWQSSELNRQVSVGVQGQFTQSFESIELLSGFDVDLTRAALVETQAQPFSPTIPQGTHYDYRVNALVYSPFVLLKWHLNDNWLVRVGTRYDRTRYQYDNRLIDGSACADNVEGCRFTRPEDQSVSYAQWSSQMGLQYQLNDSQNLYGQVSSGYRAPQATELFRLQSGQTIAELDAETAISYELGYRFFGESVSAHVAFYQMKKNEVIFQDTQRQNISGGEIVHRGVEGQLRWQIHPNWQWTANVSHANHQYGSDLPLSNQAIDGNEIDTAPPWLASSQLAWLSPAGHRIELDWVYQGKYYLDPENSARYDGHQLLNLRAKFALSQQLELSAHITNILDTDYAERADIGFGEYRYFVGEPRSLFLSVNWQWQQ